MRDPGGRQRGRGRGARLGAAASLLVLSACAGTSDRPEDAWGAWVEGPLELPAPPAREALIEVDLASAGRPYRYLVDPASLSVGPDDVTRYTIVLVSPEGARTVFYEGIRCSAGQAKTFAYGASDGTFRLAPEADWEPISRDGHRSYRFTLARGYLCTPRALPYAASRLPPRLGLRPPPGLRSLEGY